MVNFTAVWHGQQGVQVAGCIASSRATQEAVQQWQPLGVQHLPVGPCGGSAESVFFLCDFFFEQ